MDITKKFKDNLGVIIAICTVIGVVIGVVNFFILTSVAPIEKRVEALEDIKLEFMPLDLSTEKWKNNDREHTTLMTKLDKIDVKIDRLLEK